MAKPPSQRSGAAASNAADAEPLPRAHWWTWAGTTSRQAATEPRSLGIPQVSAGAASKLAVWTWAVMAKPPSHGSGLLRSSAAGA